MKYTHQHKLMLSVKECPELEWQSVVWYDITKIFFNKTYLFFPYDYRCYVKCLRISSYKLMRNSRVDDTRTYTWCDTTLSWCINSINVHRLRWYLHWLNIHVADISILKSHVGDFLHSQHSTISIECGNSKIIWLYDNMCHLLGNFMPYLCNCSINNKIQFASVRK